MDSTTPGRRTRAVKFVVLGALVSMSAALFPTMASAAIAGKSVYMKQAMKFDGQSWLMTIYASDYNDTDDVTVTLRKGFTKKKDGKLIYKLSESQSYSFSNLNESTVVIKSDLTGSINLGEQHPGLFEGNIEFGAIDGKGIEKKCNGNIKTRIVKSKGSSTMSLKTGNSLFGNITKVPAKATVTSDNGKCNSSHSMGCPAPGKGMYGYGDAGDAGSFSWSANAPSAGKYGTMYLSRSRVLAENVYWYANMGGKVQKSRITVQNDLSSGKLDASNLPKLSGKANVTQTGSKYTGDWYNCGKDKRYRSISRPGDQSGDLTYSPSGEGAMGINSDFDFDYASLTEMQVGNR